MILGHPFTSYATEVRCKIKQMFAVDHQWIDETHLIQELIRNLVNKKYCSLPDIKLKKNYFAESTQID